MSSSRTQDRNSSGLLFYDREYVVNGCAIIFKSEYGVDGTEDVRHVRSCPAVEGKEKVMDFLMSIADDRMPKTIHPLLSCIHVRPCFPNKVLRFRFRQKIAPQIGQLTTFGRISHVMTT